MTHEEMRLEKLLREVTRATDPSRDQPLANSGGDAEGLAEIWQELSRLLAAAQRDSDSSDLLKRLRRRMFRRRTRQYGLLAAAAVVLIAIGLGWTVLLGNRAGQPLAAPDKSSIAKQQAGSTGGDRPAVVQAPVVAPAPDGAAIVDVAAADSWNSALDSQIAQLDKELQSGLAIQGQTDRQIEAFDQQLTSFRQEVEADSL